MAVNNSLTKQSPANKIFEFKAGDEKVKLSPNTVKALLVSGNADKVTYQEVMDFINLCRYQHLNPFLREAYLVKYGNSPATLVTGKEAFTKRAQRNVSYKGNQAGIIVQKEDGSLENRVGSLVLEEETLVGGWAKVFIEGYKVPAEVSVSLNEYIGTKSDGTVNSQWTKRPATMIRKVALVQALREAFPDDFSGMYSQEEMGVDSSELSDTPVEIPTDQPETEQTPIETEQTGQPIEAEIIEESVDPFA